MGQLSKSTFDSVIRWGLGTGSECSEEEIERATQHAFELLKGGRIADAARALKFPRIGISRISKVLALSDQHELGIYDSRSAHGLSDLMTPLAGGLSQFRPAGCLRETI
jgi:hypothetical protein